MPHALLIAAPTSGSGKTTFTLGLLRQLRDQGLRVQPFKCGPDYIDTIYHGIAAGRESVNLDTFMSSPEHVCELFQHYGADADVCIIEGAMGLFDGYDGARGSAAEIAMLLDVPVVLLVPAKAVAYSVAPLIHGFRTFNPRLRLAGVVFNFVASDRQEAILRRACEDAATLCLGCLRRAPGLAIPSRHLGLTIEEQEKTEGLICNIAQSLAPLPMLVEGGVLPKLSACVRTETQMASDCPAPSILVARDAAFNFTYRANIDALRRMGKVEYFSPFHDTILPHCDLLYLPGGYPELFAKELAANANMRRAIRDFAEAGGHIIAECGGFMYLCRDIDGSEMCGVLPMSATMSGARLHLGYRRLHLQPDTPQMSGLLSLLPWLSDARGHEFHYSTIREEPLPPTVQCITAQLSADGTPVATPIYIYKNVIAGYTHWYWADGRRGAARRN